MDYEVWMTVTDAKTNDVVSITLIKDGLEGVNRILGNLHISRLKECQDNVILVQTDGTFNRFFDLVVD